MPGPVRGSFYLPESRKHFRPQKDFHTKHIRIELSLDFQKKRASGSCTLTLEPLRSGLRAIRLDACNLDIDEVTVDGKAEDFEYDGKNLRLKLSDEVPKETRVKVGYSTVPIEGIFFTSPDEKNPQREVQAWSHNQADFARYWYPCFDHPDDRSTTELVITVPRGFRVISNGRLISNKDGDKTSTFHWLEDIPHSTYLTSFVAGKFAEVTEEADGVSCITTSRSRRGTTWRGISGKPLG